MSKIYSTRIKFSKQRARRRSRTHHERDYASAGWKKIKRARARLEQARRSISKAFLATSFVFLVATIGVGIFVMSYLQGLYNDLPSLDKPFGKQNVASEMYDRNGNLLYRLFDEENRDPVKLEEVPPLLIWTFLAAEDVRFYEHPGIDVKAIARCGLKAAGDGETSCGASTITQQLIKQTALTNEKALERKLKEIIMAVQIERIRTKEEILEMYLTVVPEGSNVYSIKTAADFYFGKELKDLNLAEMAILAAIPQNPSVLSPTKSIDPESGRIKLAERHKYVLDQLERNMDYINSKYKEVSGKTEDLLNKDVIAQARKTTLSYKSPEYDIKSPHFVFYAIKLLQQRGYNNGVAFDPKDLETGGYKIWTTLDPVDQQIAEEQVRIGVDTYTRRKGAENAALVAIRPKTGEVVAMMGSYGYSGQPTPAGCTLGLNCRYEPQVNVTDTLQSYGSSMKPMVYYYAIMDGLIAPGSLIPDIPIKLGGYTPKNYEGGFVGMSSARIMLSKSRNIPAIYLVDQIGVDRFISEMKNWGYTTFTNSAYGPAVSVGGADVKLVEHAQAYTTFANGGYVAQHEVILKIEDRDGKVIYEHKPQLKQVADPRGVYLINDILNGRRRGPGVSWDGRDVSGKTGTSENQKEVLFATYTPELVVVGWSGNNNNQPMYSGTSGFGQAQPWIGKALERMSSDLPPTPFARPDGVYYAGGDLRISGIGSVAGQKSETFIVCKDQQDKLARKVDIDAGMSMKKSFTKYIIPNPRLQKTFDAWQNKKGYIPTEPCTVPR